MSSGGVLATVDMCTNVDGQVPPPGVGGRVWPNEIPPVSEKLLRAASNDHTSLLLLLLLPLQIEGNREG